jgi:hypothetical protein
MKTAHLPSTTKRGLCAAFLFTLVCQAWASEPLDLSTSTKRQQAPTTSLGFRLINDEQDLSPELRNLSQAIGLVQVYPFRKRNAFIQCTATHVGGGYVLTAGHCFLGAPDCNGATVTFGIPGTTDSQVVTTCQHVIRTEAAVSAYGSSRQDFTLFKVDNPPAYAVNLAESQPAERGTRLVALGFPRLVKPRGRKAMALSTNCSITHLVGNDLFQRPRAPASVLHTCSTAPGMNGALMFDVGSLKPVALHQAGSVEAIPDHQTWSVSENNNIAQALDRLPDLHQLNPQTRAAGLPQLSFQPERPEPLEDPNRPADAQPLDRTSLRIRVGSHLVEAFPLGVNDDLRLSLGRFTALGQGHRTLSISAKTGTETALIITDANGIEHRLHGYGYFEDTLAKQYDAPIDLRVETTRQAKSFSADIQIRSPEGGLIEPLTP